MLVLFHVSAALTSLILAALAYIRPSRKLLGFSGLLVALTLTSGTVLAVNQRAHLMNACLSGLIYLVFVSVELFLARRRLVKVLANMS